MRRGTLIIGSLLIGWIFGPPVTGAVAALFWREASHSNPKLDAVEQIFAQLGFSPAWRAIGDRPHSPRCGDELRSKEVTPEGISVGEENLLLAVDALYRLRLRNEFKKLAVDAIYALPAPVVGGLRSCVNGSPASIFCEQYVIRRVERATSLPPATQQKLIGDANSQKLSALCIVDPVD